MTTLELERLAARVIPPAGATGICATVDVERCSRLQGGGSSGLVIEAGQARPPRTMYGVAWVIDGRVKSRPVQTFDRGRDAFRLIQILEAGPTSRSASSFGPDAHRGRPEQGAEPAAETAGPDRAPAAAAYPGDAPLPDDASPAAVPPGLAAGVGAMPEPLTAAGFCKACGRGLVPSAAGQKRQTCDDACRQAYRRGRRAPAVTAGVVDAASAERLSRLPRPTSADLRATGGPAGDQLLLAASDTP